MTDLAFSAPAPVLLPIAGSDLACPVRRVYCVGRNYAEHAREMGGDPSREAPFFFQKNPDNLNSSGEMPYPTLTEDLHFEVELAVVLHKGGRDIAADQALSHVFGYAVALDMTRRDLQAAAKKAGRPWEAAKAAEQSAPIGAILPASTLPASVLPWVQSASIQLQVNGTTRQSGQISDMIWSIPEIIAHLSQLFILEPGDVILTGTPAGVGACVVGDQLKAEVTGLPPLSVHIV